MNRAHVNEGRGVIGPLVFELQFLRASSVFFVSPWLGLQVINHGVTEDTEVAPKKSNQILQTACNVDSYEVAAYFRSSSKRIDSDSA